MDAGQGDGGPLILLIDDDPDCRRDLGEALIACGFRPLAAESGERGLKLLEHHDIAAVITDWQMPGMDGLAVAEAVRLSRCGTPVVLITGSPDWRGAAETARRHGVRRCLRKPLNLRELMSCLGGVLYNRNQGRSAAGALRELAEAAGV
ncbi:MAG: response regulator [Thermodesulfobacteriota bacterium]